MMLSDTVMMEIQRSPVVMRALIKLVRQRGPVVRLGNFVFVTGAKEAREVFMRVDDFLPGVEYAPKLAFGPSVLGMDKTPVYDAEREAVRVFFDSPDQIARFGALVAEACRERTEATDQAGHMDFVEGFIEPVLMEAMCKFYGPTLEKAKSRYLATEPGARTVAHWLRKLGGLLICSVPAPFGRHALRERLMPEMRDWLLEATADPQGDSMLAALKGAANRPSSLMSDEDIVRCVGTMMLAGATMVKGAALALNQLLLRDRVLPDLMVAAQNGRTDIVLDHVWEALRFAPVFPILPRYCPRETAIALGTPYETRVPANATVVVSPLGAMLDPRYVEQPEEFVLGRDDKLRFHFAFGPHECVARLLATSALGALLTHIFAHYRLRAGKLRYDGPTVASYFADYRFTEARTHVPPVSSYPPRPHYQGPGARPGEPAPAETSAE